DRAMITKLAKPEVACEGKILVLDDEKSLAEMLSEMLELFGYTTTVRHTPMEALALIEEQEFDLIISDFRMPGINGQQFYDLAIQKKPALAQRIIFVTGDLVNEETQKFLQSTGNPHLPKPFSLVQVKAAVAEVIQRNSTTEPGASAISLRSGDFPPGSGKRT
ncbi:MAG: hypothetical protein JWQ71_2465, partial [Pedosphaera sp.]|nr:hypothetical protein [Pedosphaera sp.]